MNNMPKEKEHKRKSERMGRQGKGKGRGVEKLKESDFLYLITL
jgi:hypothetical protein